MNTRRKGSMTYKTQSSMVLALLMVAQTVPLNVMAFNLSSSSKKSGFAAPVYSKLESSSSASTSDSAPQAAAPDLSPVKLEKETSNASAQVAAPKQADELAPVSMAPTAETQANSDTSADPAAASAEADTLNATVEKQGYVPKPPVERTDNVVGEESVVPKGKPSKKQAKADAFDKVFKETGMKMGPVELQVSDEEMNDKVVTIVDAEKAELAEVWDAALCRNQDIQFVVQKLMPSKDPKHSTAVMMKMLSTAMYGAMAGSGMAASSMGTGAYMAQNAGASLVMSVLNSAQSRAARKASVTETEAIMLYNMIRGVADKVVDNFHAYKKGINQVGRACTDYEDMQKMVSDARAAQSVKDQLECEFDLRKARREIDGLNEDVRHSRQALVVLSGGEAVDILDKQIAIESSKIGQPIESQPQDSQTTENAQVAAVPEATTEPAVANKEASPGDAQTSKVSTEQLSAAVTKAFNSLPPADLTKEKIAEAVAKELKAPINNKELQRLISDALKKASTTDAEDDASDAPVQQDAAKPGVNPL